MTAVLNVLIDFTGANGTSPRGSLMADANGNLFGTTYAGGVNDDGTVFEIAKTSVGYANTATTLVSFDDANGANPWDGLILDNNGNLFGTTESGGAYSGGTAFEIIDTPSGYASVPTTLVSFNGTGVGPRAGLLTDANGDLFGTTTHGAWYQMYYIGGAVFEIAKTGTGYASTPTALVGFYGSDGSNPCGGLIADASGNLFGTTSYPNGGTVFELAKTTAGYALTPTTLATFGLPNGKWPMGSLVADACGNLFGTTSGGGAYNDGTVFEIARTASGYASTVTTLVSFNGANGSSPQGSLIVDANGNLFGTTAAGGTYNDGTVFEIARTGSVYASIPTVLVSFDGTDGNFPNASLIADAAGNLYGTTSTGGTTDHGTVFEITNGGFVVAAKSPAPNDFTGNDTSDILFRDLNSGNISQFVMTNGQPAFSCIGMADPRLQVVGTGDFNGDGTADILFRDPASGNLSQFVMHNGQPTFATVGIADSRLQVAGTGDFNGDGTSDILFRDPTSGNLSQFIMNNGQPTFANVGLADPQLQVAAIGDLNSDGTSDVLFRDPTSGKLSQFIRLDGQPTFAYIGTADPQLRVAGIGDLNGDGSNDILFRDPVSGNLGDFVMHYGQPSWDYIGWADPRLQVAGIGDYNGDGTSDILFRDPTGGGLGMFAMHNNQPTWTPIGWAAPALQVTA